MLIRGARPTGTSIVAAGGLGAAVEDHDQGSASAEVLRDIGSGKQIAWVRSEAAELIQPQVRIIVQGLRQAPPQSGQASDCVMKAGNVRSPAPLSALAPTPQELFCCSAA